MNTYEINNNTIALIYENNNTRIIEVDKEIVINNIIPTNIIKYSCEYFGSSYEGRVKGTNKLTGLTHKVPIIVEESNDIIFFPTSSSRLKECSWIRLKYIKEYKKIDKKSTKLLTFNNLEININVSYEIINNQILRSSRLEGILRYRKM